MLLLGGTNSVINHAVYNSNILNLTKSEVEDLVKLLNKDEQEKFKVYLMSLNKEQVFNCNSILTFVNETINQQQENEKNQLFDKVIQNQEKELEVNNLNL
jgi:benzoyl-CoA reductase/2-hydroxyglutaryl-CoA dehydratase subunit BcrC/BadD/HgdB